MTAEKRRVEVFTSGCPLCKGAVRLVTALACPSCEVRVYDLREGCRRMNAGRRWPAMGSRLSRQWQ